MTKPAKYPTAFHVAHRLYTGPYFPPEGSWGDVLDGPMADEDAVIDALLQSFHGEDVSRENLRVWYVEGGRAWDCTFWALACIDDARAEEEE